LLAAGFEHATQPSSIDLNVVRLCFQVFLPGSSPRVFDKVLTPVVSSPIYDKSEYLLDVQKDEEEFRLGERLASEISTCGFLF